ncbi:MAG: hypothetical protein LBB22_05480, partial [Treponema sp.]|nr:hypothetical protein [Treponema sp.]
MTKLSVARGILAALAVQVLILGGCAEAGGTSGGGVDDYIPKDEGKKDSGGSGGAAGFQVVFDPQGGSWTLEDDADYWKNTINADGTVNLPSA